MPIEISWATIGKLVIAGLATYVLLPLALVVRDWLLRKTIQKIVLTQNCKKKITELAWLERQLDKHYSQPSGGGWKDGEEFYRIGEKIVPQHEYLKYCGKQHEIMSRLKILELELHNRSSVMAWVFHRYKQAEPNPVPQWVEEARERFKNFGGKATKGP